ncbi:MULTISPECIES: hypothetical protein [Pediococcus]|jgi:membrane protein implicated in regulation of membrane protease activity|uniref:Uncharacterized protein n=1 Tax=Pediococcus parvulus TaxID=54062 RepID=A0A176TLM9_9LACO|nr:MULTISPECIES: hypothetical protein [Pediococcus]MCT3027997.1 hypothetical protein [Pediococcus parvulus]MCT3028320.1 hypothetical protein [Pediococcus parvulus]MCT3030313.1 hypothetical protein [Pediococcus parvulus]MCT3033979.1 hypothetical protein [Pediococcus parvulus]MDN5574628.1 hypothetical protein [Pediococcus sp.]
MLKAALVGVPGLIAIMLVVITLYVQLPFWLLIVLWAVGFVAAIILVTVFELKIKLAAMKRDAEEAVKKEQSEK